MSVIRNRVKEHLPTVLLTLLSIVQALALELLWGHLQTADVLYRPGLPAVLWWSQVAATFLGIIVIWVVYASSAMRFRWVPTLADSVYPFVVGAAEFLLVATLGPEHLGVWFLTMAFVFATMNWVSHDTLRRARRDPENAEFFDHRRPATWRDFRVAMVTVAGLGTAGVGFLVWPAHWLAVVLAMLAINALLAAQLYAQARFWDRSVAARESE